MTPKRPIRLFTKLKCLVFIILEITVSSQVLVNDSVMNCQLWNAALCKPANQINVWAGGTPDRAVDGNRNTRFHDGSCSHTFAIQQNWWMVDLMDEYLVHKVIVSNRGDSYAWRFKSVYIDLFQFDPRLDTEAFPENTDGTLCVKVITAFEGTKSFDCASPTYARYVKLLYLDQDNLSFCEVEVMVSNVRGDSGCTKAVSKSFNITRNSVVEDGEIVLSTTSRAALACVDMCRSQGHLCNGCYWTENTRECQLLKVDPYNPGQVVTKQGTDFYVESPIQCAGVGTGEYQVG